MKTLKQIKEEYNEKYLEDFDAPEMVSLEESKDPTIPSTSNMPQVLVFRRTSYRLYPNKQVVALYYSKMLDKYLSIPFGPGGNLNLSEAVIHEKDDPCWKGYEMVGMKKKGGKKVPNCVPVKEQEASATRYSERPTYEENKYPDTAERGIYEGHANAVEAIHSLYSAHRKGNVKQAVTKVSDTHLRMLAKRGTGYEKNINDSIMPHVHKEIEDRKNISDYTKKVRSGISEDWQSVNRKDKTDGLSQKAVNAYKRENPGSKLQTAVTEKNPKGKRASRRKSFCSRMGGMKKRLTSAKTARDPDSRINKALRRWNCEEDFKLKLAQIREERQQVDEMWPLIAGAGRLALGTAAGEAIYQGAKKFGGAILRKLKPKAPVTPKPRKAPPTQAPKKSGGAATSAAADAAGGAAGSLVGTAAIEAGKAAANALVPSLSSDSGKLVRDKPGVKTYSSWEKGAQGSPVQKERQRQALMKENKISDIRSMIGEGTPLHEMEINGRTVTLNTSMAKRILEVYDSVNTKNKKIVESMLNEDLESFKKLLNFSIKA